MESHHLPITVECSNRIVFAFNEILNTKKRAPRRPKLSFRNFDKVLFPILIQESIDALSLYHCSIDPLQAWYEFVLDYSLKAGVVLYDDLGNKKEYIKGKLVTISLKKRDH